MNYRLTIHCTREHLEKAKWCGIDTSKQLHANNPKMWDSNTTNCWIAAACQEIFPLCNVSSEINNIARLDMDIDISRWYIPLPYIAKDMIHKFDSCITVEERMKLEPFSFTVDIPQETLGIIMECNGLRSMTEFNEIIFRTPHLQLETVEN